MNRFWHGDYSLALSFWVITPLVVALAFALPEGVGWLVRTQDFNPLLVFAAIVAIWGIVIAAQVYATVGLWRSAARRHGTWAAAVQVVLVLSALNTARLFVQAALPELSEGIGMALFDDPSLPPYAVRLMRDGTEAEVAGGFKYGLARDAEALFETAPNLRVVHLNSAGGRLGEAAKLARLIKARGLATYSADVCASACTVAYAAGSARYLRAGARLGFHRGIFAGNENAAATGQLLLEAGIAPAFVERAIAQPAESVWYPTDQELLAARAVTLRVDANRFAASGLGANTSLIAVEQALRRTPAFTTLAAAQPDLFEDMAELYLRRYVEGWSTGQIEDELRHTRVAPFLAQRLPQAEDEILVAYAYLLADQYSALGRRDPGACFGYVTRGGDAQVMALIGPDLQKRELALTERVMRSHYRRSPPAAEAVQAANAAVNQALLGQFEAAAINLLAEPAKVQPAQHELFCRVAAARLRAIADLPSHQAGDLMSRLFTRK
ncbi:MAG: hypothetical protein J0J01_15985 [Reyranella sp.]|uniref:COG3904 family protein n=1 Tax=Reyranella sp. TaxID=1929291 RepID=UPI001AD3E745|nr:hypothetical protein [Reyranella sp.]MBN9088406.1 hypothetical protein [Reyranella sp.]